MRAVLNGGGCRVGLDSGRVAAGLDGCQPPGDGVRVNPLISMKDRRADGFDAEGNPRWKWESRLDGVQAVTWQQREERDDRAGVTLVRVQATVLYPVGEPNVRETAMCRTEDGNIWSVKAIARHPDRLVIDMQRVDDGD